MFLLFLDTFLAHLPNPFKNVSFLHPPKKFTSKLHTKKLSSKTDKRHWNQWQLAYIVSKWLIMNSIIMIKICSNNRPLIWEQLKWIRCLIWNKFGFWSTKCAKMDRMVRNWPTGVLLIVSWFFHQLVLTFDFWRESMIWDFLAGILERF